MTHPAHFKALEQMYAAAPVNEFYHPEMTVSLGKAEIEINIHSFGHSHTLKKGIKMVTEKQSMALSLNRNYGDDIPAARVHI